MALYFFHTNHPALPVETTGKEFDDLNAAKCGAVRYAGQLLCDVAEHFWDTRDFKLNITTESGLVLLTLRVVGTEAPATRLSGSSA